ncbi:sensor histidine kinase [Streptomyces sp. NPDC057621]|uniref:sensor histidine kinase n=1 Tax=Streptomyces sp. NPDC057621 TaxID=3346186 RepID=UPI00368B8E5D
MTRRLLLSYLSITLLVLLGLEVPLGHFYASGEVSRFVGDQRHAAEILAGNLEYSLERGAHDETHDLVADFVRTTGSRTVVADSAGKVLIDSAQSVAAGTDLSADDDVATVLRTRTVSTTRGQQPGSGDTFTVTAPGSTSTDIHCVVRVLYPLDALESRIHGTWMTLALIGLGVLLVVTIVALALAHWVTRPLRALERATAALADGRLTGLPAVAGGPPELRRLAVTFSITAHRLQHLLQAHRSFASEASHQLKTPLTALRLRLENFEPYLDTQAHGSLDEAVEEVERLGRMVHGLLALARLENSASTPERADLDAVVADRALTWSAFAAEHRVEILVTGPDVGEVWAIPDALEQIIDNLLSNALRVSPPGTTITLAKAPAHVHRPPMAELHVIDEGPGMTEPERERAFDRFWRAADSYHEGTGLGLPIVQQLTRAGAGEVLLRQAPGGGLDAVVRLQPAGRDTNGAPLDQTSQRAWVSAF